MYATAGDLGILQGVSRSRLASVAAVQSGPVLVSGPRFRFGLAPKPLEPIIHLPKMDMLCSHVDWMKINSTYL